MLHKWIIYMLILRDGNLWENRERKRQKSMVILFVWFCKEEERNWKWQKLPHVLILNTRMKKIRRLLKGGKNTIRRKERGKTLQNITSDLFSPGPFLFLPNQVPSKRRKILFTLLSLSFNFQKHPLTRTTNRLIKDVPIPLSGIRKYE